MKAQPRGGLVLNGPHEVVPKFNVDWTRQRPPGKSPSQWFQEVAFRDMRNIMLVDSLIEGRIVTFQSTGSLMWPLVQANDVCTFAP